MKENVNKHQIAAIFVPSLFSIVLCLHKNFWLITPHLCYSPNFELCDFFLFQKLQMAFEERKFNNITMIFEKLHSSDAQVQTVQIKKCFRQWCHHWACY
jgi:hypothetical protein